MRKVFQTFDGAIFETEKEATDHEYYCHQSMLVIIDDDADILEILGTKLVAANIKHKLFRDPLEAMNYISNNHVAHVYTDYHMKGYGMSGHWIKEICAQKKVSCSIVSADESFADIIKTDFLENVITHIMLKPNLKI
jgi:DNA-binding NtrC family response regulator